MVMYMQSLILAVHFALVAFRMTELMNSDVSFSFLHVTVVCLSVCLSIICYMALMISQRNARDSNGLSPDSVFSEAVFEVTVLLHDPPFLYLGKSLIHVLFRLCPSRILTQARLLSNNEALFVYSMITCLYQHTV